ncbi:MAG: gamma-glutamylcyclotransferase family protein [Alphaproteobacteria bacterium]
MIARIPPQRLFVYGTLCDRDLFAAVAGKSLTCFYPMPARAPNTRTVLAADEAMPLLRRGGTVTKGLLLKRLDSEAWRRIRFYEDDVYRLSPVRLLIWRDTEVIAHAFWPKPATRYRFQSWNFRDWRRVRKPHALVAARQFMEYLDAPPGTDLAQVWRDIQELA